MYSFTATSSRSVNSNRDIKDSITASSPWYSYEENDKPLIVHLYGNNSSDSETITVDNLPYEEDHGTDHLKS